MKKTITLAQERTPLKGDPTYDVIALTNTAQFQIGQTLTKIDVERLINTRLYEIKIVPFKR